MNMLILLFQIAEAIFALIGFLVTVFILSIAIDDWRLSRQPISQEDKRVRER